MIEVMRSSGVNFHVGMSARVPREFVRLCKLEQMLTPRWYENERLKRVQYSQLLVWSCRHWLAAPQNQAQAQRVGGGMLSWGSYSWSTTTRPIQHHQKVW